MAKGTNDGGFWMRPEWFGLIAGQSDENAGKLIKQMIITVENDGNPGEIPAKLAQNRAKIGMAWGTIFPRLREQILGRKNGKKGGNPAFSEKGGYNPPAEPPVETPDSKGRLEPYNTILHSTIPFSYGVVSNSEQSKGEAKPNRTEPNEKQVHIPTISEVSDFAHESGFTDMQRVADWFDNNAKKWKWKSVRAGEDWKKLLTAYYMAKYPTWGNAESAADQHEHSFDEAEFLAAALKRSFITDHKEPQQKAAGDDLPF